MQLAANKPKVLVSGPLLNTCTSIFDIFYLLTSLFRTQNGLDCIYSYRTKDLTKKCFDELHSTKSYRKKNKCLINVIIAQHHRRLFTQISRKPVVFGYIVAGFVGGFGWFCSWFWVVLGRFGWFRVLVTTIIARRIPVCPGPR